MACSTNRKRLCAKDIEMVIGKTAIFQYAYLKRKGETFIVAKMLYCDFSVFDLPWSNVCKVECRLLYLLRLPRTRIHWTKTDKTVSLGVDSVQLLIGTNSISVSTF